MTRSNVSSLSYTSSSVMLRLKMTVVMLVGIITKYGPET